MSSYYKEAKIKNRGGTTLVIASDSCLSVGYGGTNAMVRGNEKVIAFDNWTGLVDAIDAGKHAYHKSDHSDV